MKIWLSTALLLTALGARAGAATLKDPALDQAVKLAGADQAPLVYDGSRNLPSIEAYGMAAAPASARPSAATIAAPPPPAHAAAVDQVPMPREWVAVPAPARAAAPAAPLRRYYPALGALVGMAAGFSLSVGLSKILA